MSLGVSCEEVMEVLCRASRGEIPLVALDGVWGHFGEPRFNVGGWTIKVFNDCGDVDYVDSAISPDGRVGTCHDWWKEADLNPLDLGKEDYVKIVALITSAK